MLLVRRLAAILVVDVAGYLRLMGADEEGTRERLQAHLRELVDPKINEHRGRIVKNTGDGFLAEFASVLTPFELRDTTGAREEEAKLAQLEAEEAKRPPEPSTRAGSLRRLELMTMLMTTPVCA